ncbi:MAG: co-chaperone GroES [Patescibacteria group bacterium]
MKKPKKKAPARKKAKTAPAKSAKKNEIGRPYGDRVLVRPGKPEEMTSFGLIIPESAKEKPEQGTVVAVGAGRRDERGTLMPLMVKPGDRIMFSKYGYDEVTINGVDYYLIREESITYVF